MIDAERANKLVIAATKNLSRLGGRFCRYALLTQGGPGANPQLPYLEMGMVRYVKADGRLIESGPMMAVPAAELFPPEETADGTISYKEWAGGVPDFAVGLRNCLSGPSARYEYKRHWRTVRHAVRSLGATVLANQNRLPASAAWCRDLDYDSRCLQATIHCPEGTQTSSMQILLTLQGHTFEKSQDTNEDYIWVDSPYVPPEDILPYIVQYGFETPVRSA